MSGLSGAELAFAAGYALRFVLVCGTLAVVAHLIVHGAARARRGGWDG